MINNLLSHSIYYCGALLGFASPHIPKELNLIIALSGLAFLGIILVRIVNTFLHIKTIKKELMAEINLPDKLEILVSELNLIGKVKLVNSKKPLAFCFGLLNPKIYISSTLLKTMSFMELKAIFLHERYHLRNHDTLTLFIGRVIENLFPFFPTVSDLIKTFRVKREINADNEANRIMGNKSYITDAIQKFLVIDTPVVTFYPAFVPADSLTERILALTDKKSPRRLNLNNVFLSLLSFLIILGVVAIPISAYEIHHDHTDTIVVCVNSNSKNFSLPTSQIAH